MSVIEPTTNGVTAWASRIRPHLLATAESIISTGAELLAAKAALPHGAFGPLLDELGLSRQMANRFMRVASNEVLANRSPVGGLPAAVSVLDVLAQLGDTDLADAIDTGAVTAATTRSDAEALVRRRTSPEAEMLSSVDARELVDGMRQRLTVPAGATLGDLEDAVPGSMASVGALLAIRDGDLYRALGHPTFGAYLQDRWRMAVEDTIAVIDELDALTQLLAGAT